MRLDVLRALKNPQQWDQPGGYRYFCPVEQIWYKVAYWSPKSALPLCPRRHRLIVRETLNTPEFETPAVYDKAIFNKSVYV